jgi:hypothetical protein
MVFGKLFATVAELMLLHHAASFALHSIHSIAVVL